MMKVYELIGLSDSYEMGERSSESFNIEYLQIHSVIWYMYLPRCWLTDTLN